MDRELTNEIMEGTPLYWMPIITPHLFQDLEQLQLSVKFHEESLLKLGGGITLTSLSVCVYIQNFPKENSQRSSYNPFINACVDFIGWTKATSNPQFPKDDSNVLPMPGKKGAHPCQHCGSGKHWDQDCKHARTGVEERNFN